MLNVKKLLTKILNQTTYSIQQSTVSNISIASGSTAWASVNMVKSGMKLVGLSGWYIQGSGNTNCVIYALLQTSTGASVALKNNGTSAASITLRLDGVYVNS